MNPLNEVQIVEQSTLYDITMNYHSDLKCQNEQAIMRGVEEADGKVTLKPGRNPIAVGFVFEHSDPDRVIAVAQMMLSFAQMVKNNNKKSIDISDNEC